MLFTTIGLVGAVVVVASLVGTALAIQLRERHRRVWFDAEVADLREEMERLEAQMLSDEPAWEEAPVIELRKAELSESLLAALRTPPGGTRSTALSSRARRWPGTRRTPSRRSSRADLGR